MSYRSMKYELLSFCPELNAVQAGIRINRAYEHLLALHPWSFLNTEDVVATVAPYTTGTLSIASGGTTATGTGTAWTTSMGYNATTGAPGWQVQLNSDIPYHNIYAVNAIAQTFTMGMPPVSGTYVAETYRGTTLTLSDYRMWQERYLKPTGCRDIMSVRYDMNMPEKTKRFIDTVDPNRESTGQPEYWYNFDDTTFCVWPVPDAVYLLRVAFHKSIGALANETDTTVIPERVVVLYAIQQTCLQLSTSIGVDPNVAKQYGAVYAMMAQDKSPTGFDALWNAAIEDDRRKLTLPTTVVDVGYETPYSNDYWMKHDVLDPRRP